MNRITYVVKPFGSFTIFNIINNCKRSIRFSFLRCTTEYFSLKIVENGMNHISHSLFIKANSMISNYYF